MAASAFGAQMANRMDGRILVTKDDFTILPGQLTVESPPAVLTVP
jgi:hypothetical protein